MHLVRRARFVAPLAFALLLGSFVPGAHAADDKARIKGTVVDPTGAAVPNVEVDAVNEKTGAKFNTKTQGDGAYLFPQLPIGTYDVTVAAPGFQAFVAKGIVLNIDQEYVEQVKLALGSETTTLEVAADPVQVNTSDMQLNNIVNSQQMTELPLIGRAFTGLELIEPGVQASSDRFGSYSVSGAQSQQSSYLINGADTNDITLNTLSFSPILDAIDQFNLIDGPLNAEYDRNSGGIVSVSIKSGTNHVHGDAFEFYRDTFLNTPNFFAQKCPSTGPGPCTKVLPPYHQNIFGATLGGPLLRDRLFLFGGYQGIRQFSGTTSSPNVFSDAQRTGDFSTSANGTNPLQYNIGLNPTTKAPYGGVIPGTITALSSNPLCAPGLQWGPCLDALGGVIPASAINPLSAKLISTYFPHANSGANSYTFSSTSRINTDQFLGRVDYQISPRDQVYFIGIYQHSTTNANIPFTGATVPGFGELDYSHTQQYTADYVHQFGATAVNDFAVHYTRFNYASVIPTNLTTPASLGFAIAPENTAYASVPFISTGYGSIGFSTNGPQPRIDPTYQLDDNFSKSLGQHQLKFGYDGRKFYVSNPFSGNNNGSYAFSTNSGFSTGDPGLDFLLGMPNSYSQGSGATIQAYAYLNYLYAQDTWKVSNAFTLSYGLGFQMDTPMHNLQYGGEGIACYIPGEQSTVIKTAPKGIVYPGDPGCTNSAQATMRFSEFGPRIGFAYAPDLGWLSGQPGKFSLRGGFGIYYNRTEEETSLNNLETPPFGISSSGAVDYGAAAPGFQNPYQDLDTGTVYTNKFPYTFPTTASFNASGSDYSFFEPTGINTYLPGFRAPYALNFQLSLEREFAARTIVRASYVGSLGRHNQIGTEGNPITQAGHDACLASASCGSKTTTAYRNLQNYYYYSHTANPYVDPITGIPAYPTVGVVTSEGSSNYNALQITVNKATTHNLQLQLSYTLSHSLDDASSYENSSYGSSSRGYNLYNKALNYGNSNFDARHRLVFAPVYTTPMFKAGSPFSPVNLALSGWEISGIMTLATGFPFDISYSGGSANSLYCAPSFSFYACPDEPNLVGNYVRTNPRVKALSANGATTQHSFWFQTSGLLAAAPLGQFGNISRDKFYGPGINNTNLILAKNFNMNADGSIRLQLRMESDNVFNHTQFNNPASTVSTTASSGLSLGTVGQITSAAAARLTQLAAKVYF